jgi:predicted hotdog family 3-hydroxylacyl-ACP dehydratase
MIDIEKLIPHREPIKIITEVIEMNDEAGIAAAVVNKDWPLCDGRVVRSLVLIEAIAQSAALLEGYKRQKAGKSGVKGWLVGVKSAEFTRDLIAVNTRVVVQVQSLYAFDAYGVIKGVVKAGDEILLTAVLQAIRLNNDEM